MSAALDRPVLWRPSARQELFLAAPESEVLYGGGAGSGKSDCLIIDALGLHQLAINVPRYRAIILRRSMPELVDLIDRTKALYPVIVPGAHYMEQAKQWRFPSGAKLLFGAIDRDDDCTKYQGPEYQYCCARGTPVLMADGSYRAIEAVQVGDLVQTLEGACAVTLKPPARRMPLLEVHVGGHTTFVGSSHVALSTEGWTPLAAARSSILRSEPASSGAFSAAHRGCHAPSPCSHPDRRRARQPEPAGVVDSVLQAACASSEGARNACRECSGGSPGGPPPRQWSVPLVLHAPALRSGREGSFYQPREAGYVHGRRSAQDFPGGYPGDRGCGGEPPPHAPETSRAFLPLSAGAESRHRWPQRLDDRDSTQLCSPDRSGTWPHPYTKEWRSSSEAVRVGVARISPAGEGEVFDLRVASASHYIVRGGMISRNCGFEELTGWPTSYAWDFMRSRLRGTSLKLYMRATCNPGGVGGKWVQERWRIPDDGSASSHTVTVTVPGFGGEPDRVIDATLRFIPARLADNPHISANYAANLMRLSPNLRRALLDGRWDVYDVPGAIYAAELGAMRDQGRISRVPYDPAVPVSTAWDLGITGNPVWFLQTVGREIRLIDYCDIEDGGLGAAVAYISDKRDSRGWRFSRHYLPHDVKARESMTGNKSREMYLREAKIGPIIVVPRGEVEDGIHAVRMLLPRAWIDAIACREGVEALANYRRSYNSILGQLQAAPVHDKYSHGSDALRTLAMGLTAERTTTPATRREREPAGPGAWMSR